MGIILTQQQEQMIEYATEITHKNYNVENHTIVINMLIECIDDLVWQIHNNYEYIVDRWD